MAEKIIAVCGAGGKTTWMKRKKNQYVKEGKTVLITTTTHMAKEAHTDLSCDIDSILQHIKKDRWVEAGAADTESDAKIVSLPKDLYEKICDNVDVVLVEADGSKHMSVKFPGENEPVIPQNSTDAVLIMGVFELGKPIDQVVHRAYLAKERWKEFSQKKLSMEHIEILCDYYKNKIHERYPALPIEVCYSRWDNGYLIYENQ